MDKDTAVIGTIVCISVACILLFGGCVTGQVFEREAWIRATKLDRVPFIPLDCRNAPVQAPEKWDERP